MTVREAHIPFPQVRMPGSRRRHAGSATKHMFQRARDAMVSNKANSARAKPGNPESEARNPKQIRNANDRNRPARAKRTQSGRLGIGDCGLGIRGNGQRMSNKANFAGAPAGAVDQSRQTNPIFRGSGLKTRVAWKTKPIRAAGSPLGIGDCGLGIRGDGAGSVAARNVKQSQFHNRRFRGLLLVYIGLPKAAPGIGRGRKNRGFVLDVTNRFRL